LEEKIIELESEYNQILQEFQQTEGENAEYALKEAETWHSKINKSEN
jgi:predicted patatin/cPLA2 family phospholipase